MPTPQQSSGPNPPFNPGPAPSPGAPGDGLLFGRFGLRAGWGILLYCLLYLFFYVVAPVLAQTIQTGFGAAVAHAPASIRSQAASESSTTIPAAPRELDATFYLLSEGLLFAGLVLSSRMLAHLEDRRPGVYGIASHSCRDFLPGAFWGLVCMSLLIALLRAAHLLVFDARALTGRAILFSGAAWLAVFLAVGLSEEYLYRGYLQFTLTRGFFSLGKRLSSAHARAAAFWIAAVLMSIVFGLLHLLNGGETHLGVFSVFLAGLVFAYALWRTGSLWWAIGFHMAWDWAQSFLYGVPDSGGLSAGRLFHTHPVGNPLLSGGTVGPEGSLFLLPTVLLIALVIRFTARPGTQPPLEPETPLSGDPRETNSIIA